MLSYAAASWEEKHGAPTAVGSLHPRAAVPSARFCSDAIRETGFLALLEMTTYECYRIRVSLRRLRRKGVLQPEAQLERRIFRFGLQPHD
jgi:hypothetical protein